MSQIVIRPLNTLTEMRNAVLLQRTHWGEDSEAAIPAHMLLSIARAGGHVLAAFDGVSMVGLLVGLIGTHEQNTDRPAMANLTIVSKRMIVLADYRGKGLGYRLKLAQREIAIQQGIRLVTWTFDPLLVPNAHLNIRKLGAISEIYHEDFYGTETVGGLSLLGSSDRLQADWWVTNRRVEERLSGSRKPLELKQYLEAQTVIINPSLPGEDGVPMPGAAIGRPGGTLALVEIPAYFPHLAETQPDLAWAWRRQTRAVFQDLMLNGYVVTDFLRETHEGRDRAFYLTSQINRSFEQLGFSRN